MSIKKNANIERNVAKKAEKKALHKKLENSLVANTGFALVLAVIFMIMNNYKSSSQLVVPMLDIVFPVLIWLGVAAVLVFAVLGFVLKRNDLFKWSAIGAINSICWYLFGFVSRGVKLCYVTLIAYFVMFLLYYFLAYYGAWKKKGVRIAYFVIVAIAAILFIAATTYLMAA